MNSKNTLIPYSPDNTYPFSLTSEFTVTDESIFVSYKLSGDLSKIDLDNGHPNRKRIIGLWEKSCFELFIKNDQGQYLEFNFSSIFEWNSFFFNFKGEKLKEFENMTMPKLDILRSLETFHLIAEIDKSKLPLDFMKSGQMHAGITSVIKMKDSAVTYWALSHEDTRPNFHHFDSFKISF